VPWLRVGDNAATHPLVMRVAGLPASDARSVNETFGFLIRVATLSAAHMTDSVVDMATVQLMGGPNWEQTVRHATKLGLMTATKVDGAKAWILIDDPELFHIRKKADVKWDRQREHDRTNLDLTNAVLARDGDVCRYCDQVVNWADHKGGRGGTFDHRNPSTPATLDTYVVCCRGDNRERSNYSDADQRRPLLPPPAHPHYTTKTAERLTTYFGRTYTPSPPRPDTQPVPAKRDPAPSRTPRTAVPKKTAQRSRPATADTAPERSRPGMSPDTAQRDPAPSRSPRTDASPARPGTQPVPAHESPPPRPDPKNIQGKSGITEGRPGTGRGGIGFGLGLVGGGAPVVSPVRPRPSPSDPSSPPGRRSKRGRRSR
jgi:hypothetical protein